MNWEARASALQKQVDDLEFRVENLVSALEAHGSPYFASLTATEEKVAQLLRLRSPNVVSKQQVFDLLYAFRSEGETPEIKIVDVYICKIRPKLELLSIKIETAWARGYFMDAESARAWDLVAPARSAA